MPSFCNKVELKGYVLYMYILPSHNPDRFGGVVDKGDGCA